MTQLHKYYCKDPGVAGIKPNHYGSGFTTIAGWVSEAKRDFPELSLEDIRVVAYGGDRWKRQFGIEFKPPAGATVPDKYFRVDELEPLLAG